MLYFMLSAIVSGIAGYCFGRATAASELVRMRNKYGVLNDRCQDLLQVLNDNSIFGQIKIRDSQAYMDALNGVSKLVDPDHPEFGRE